MEKIKAIIFDMLGTLFIEGGTSKKLAKMLSLSYKNEVKPVYNKYMVGKISKNEFWTILNKSPKIEKKLLDQYRLDPDINILYEIKQNYRLAILSNIASEWGDYLITKNKLNECFDNIILSGAIGIKKPDKKIYQVALCKLKILPTECLFIDDKLECLETASRLGMSTVWYKRKDEEDNFNPDFTITKLDQLKDILTKK